MIYLSRGVEHECSDHLAGMSESEKTRIAKQVLAAVELIHHEAFNGRPPVDVPAKPEPTSTGYLDADVREFVLRRSA